MIALAIVGGALLGDVRVVGCAEPVPTTLTVTDSRYGTFSATYQGTIGSFQVWSTGNISIDFPGGSTLGCLASSDVPATYTLSVNSVGVWQSSLAYHIVLFPTHLCPGYGTSTQSAPHHFVSLSCPPSFSVRFQSTSTIIYTNQPAGTYTMGFR
jgi:hypothetical protein